MTPLDQLSDSDLSAVFAVEVAGWTQMRRVVRGAGGPEREPSPYGFPPGKNYEATVTTFATSADAVLPWLTKDGGCFKYTSALGLLTYFRDEKCLHPYHYDGQALTFPRAACLALIKAARAQESQDRARHRCGFAGEVGGWNRIEGDSP